MRSLLLLALALTLGLQTNAHAQDGGFGPSRGGGDQRCAGPEPTEQEADDKIYKSTEVTCKAMIQSRPEPEYPRGARKKNVQGTVLLRVVLLASGKIGEVSVVKGLPEGVSEAAVESARGIKFRPAIKGDRWVSQRVLIEYNFNTY